MDINVSTAINSAEFTRNNQINSVNKESPQFKTEHPAIQLTGNDAAVLLQMVTSKLSSAVIRKIPNNEYMQLLALLDRIISSSVDNQI